ncbi:MAG: NADH-quinone oxidoreductase subunit N [Terriglobales bacterium]
MFGSVSQFFGTNYLLSLPVILLTLFAVGILLIDLITPPEWKWTNAVTAMAGLLFAAAGVFKIQYTQASLEREGRRLQWGFQQSVLVDHLAIYFLWLILIGAALAILLSTRNLKVGAKYYGLFYALLLMSVVGMMIMASGFHVGLLFVGMELMALPSYVFRGLLRDDRSPLGARWKRIEWAGLSSGLVACGLILFCHFAKSTNLHVIAVAVARHMAAQHDHPGALIMAAVVATAVGIFSKLASLLSPCREGDVAEGSSISLMTFLCVTTPAACWVMALRIFLWGLYAMRGVYTPVLIGIAVVLMAGGTVVVLRQTSLKSVLAYSSLVHVGVMLLGLIGLAWADYPAPAFFDGFKGILLYLLAYVFMTAGAFGFATLQGRQGGSGDNAAGAFFRTPKLAILMLIFLLSLAGIPPLAGFYGRYFVGRSLIEGRHYVLVAIGGLVTVIGLYGYGRIARAMFTRGKIDNVAHEELLSIGGEVWAGLSVAIVATVFIGVHPQPFIQLMDWVLRLN